MLNAGLEHSSFNPVFEIPGDLIRNKNWTFGICHSENKDVT